MKSNSKLTASEQNRKIVPPAYLLLTIVLMALMDRFMPLFMWIEPPLSFVGSLLVLLGLVIIVAPAIAFSRAKTGIVPFDEATSLVTTGFYRITRNPMYLGMIMLLLGGACLFGSLGALIPIPLFIWIIRQQFILGEERFLEATFGDEYLAYKKRVRRWL